jgi:zinc transport system ATP-binding protein
MRHGDTDFCITSVEGLGVTLGRSELLRDINFTLNCGQLTAVIGRNGAGKTTLLRALLGEIPYTGRVKLTKHDGTQGKLSMGYVPQRAPLDPNSPTNVYDLCAASTSRFPAFLPKRDKGRVMNMLAAFGAENLADRRLCELSGGEWQRVMLAVATTPTPELLILDEPQIGIDMSGLRLFYEKINELQKTQDLSVLMVSHDFAFLNEYADNVLLLSHTIRKSGTPTEVFHSEEYRELFGGAESICS